MAEHIVKPRYYLVVYVTLIILTFTTIGVAHLPMPNTLHLIVGLGIASAKATLVALIFMHLLYSNRILLLVGLSGLFWLGILLVLTLADYVTRVPVEGSF
jgi:cytochrome c oxidase subunit 4